MKRLGFGKGPNARLRLLAAMGVLGAAVVAVNVNVLVARRYARWDLTSAGLYSLSEPTRRTLHALDEPVDVLVLLSRVDPLSTGVRHLLTAYRAETDKLRVDFVDPEQNPAQFAVIQQKYGVLAGGADGRIVTDASLIVTRGDRHWFITPDDMMRFDGETGRARSRLEQALTEGIVNVQGAEKATVCFSRGHQEATVSDAGPDGLAELRDRIEKSNYAVSERDLPGTSDKPFEGCRLLVIAAPRVPFSGTDAERVTDAIRGGMSALLLVGPIPGDGGVLASSGLEPVAALAEASLGRDLVIETDPDARLPRAFGEVFFAMPSSHEVTRGLVGASKLQSRVVVNQSQSVQPLHDRTKPLLLTSDKAVALRDVRPLLEGAPEGPVHGAEKMRRVLAVARELDAPKGAQHAPRIVIAGSAALAGSRNYRDGALYGNRLFVENAVSWLAARPALVSVPEKAETELGLALTEESLGEVLRYVVIYMPLSAAFIGGFVLLRRRASEKRSRAEAPKAKDEARA